MASIARHQECLEAGFRNWSLAFREGKYSRRSHHLFRGASIRLHQTRVDLDQHRGMAAQKATELRRLDQRIHLLCEKFHGRVKAGDADALAWGAPKGGL